MSEKINLGACILGFTKNTRLQTEKAKKFLLGITKLDGQGFFTIAEVTLYLLLKGYRPKILENQTTYYKKYDTIVESKPKTIYRMSKNDSGYTFNKTVNEFANYLLDNNFLDIGIVENFLANEKKEIQDQLAQEKMQREIENLNKAVASRARIRHKEWVERKLIELKNDSKYDHVFSLIDLIHEKYLGTKPSNRNHLFMLLPNMLTIQKQESQNFLLGWFHLHNVASLKTFEILTGVKLGKTVKSIREVMNNIFSTGKLELISESEVRKYILKLKSELK